MKEVLLLFLSELVLCASLPLSSQLWSSVSKTLKIMTQHETIRNNGYQQYSWMIFQDLTTPGHGPIKQYTLSACGLKTSKNWGQGAVAWKLLPEVMLHHTHLCRNTIPVTHLSGREKWREGERGYLIKAPSGFVAKPSLVSYAKTHR